MAENTPNATAPAVKHAEDNKIDLNTVTGSGENGRIELGDVRAAVEARDAEAEGDQLPEKAPFRIVGSITGGGNAFRKGDEIGLMKHLLTIKDEKAREQTFKRLIDAELIVEKED